MKIKSAFFLLVFTGGLLSAPWAQTIPSNPNDQAGEFPIAQNDADHPCITAQEYEQIEQRCAENIQLLGLVIPEHKSDLITPLNWPLRAANGLADCNYSGISAYVDQNTTAGAVSDYNCGSKTYDGHRGTDISIWPFPFYKMDNNQVEVIAAAAGTIIDKVDGNFDKNCGANALTANYLVVQHADGSRILYFHLKKNSLTAKNVGATVAVGEYLGVVGSSGNSSGPHLHFEVWAGSTNATRIDPYSGPCNTLNATTWWATPRPYAGPEILKASIHTTDAVLPACPATETLNESSCYSLPFQGSGLPPGAAKFYIFMRYEMAGMTATLNILNPDGSIFTTWTYTSTNSYNGSLKSWTKTLPVNTGTYTFQAVLNGVTCSKTFDVIGATITPSGSTTICQGSSVTLTASAGASYLWSTGASTSAISVSNAGNYTVTITNANGCSATSTATTVTVNPPPVATIAAGGATTFCQGGSVTLTASPGTSYLWSTGATTSAITASTQDSYTVRVTNANGCSATSAATVVTVNPPPVATITAGGATTFCQGGSVMLTASAGTGYLWSTGATTSAITASSQGSYTVRVTNASGCTATSTATVVTVNPPPVATIAAGGATTFCQGGSVMLTASAGTSYLWSTGATTSGITVSTQGSYTVLVTNASGCSATSTATTVTVNPPPVATIAAGGATTFCQGGSVMLTASAGTGYLWSTGATTMSINASNSGSYQVTVTNDNGCTAASAPTAVTVNPLPATPSITANGATLTSSFQTGNQWYLNGTIMAGATNQTLSVTQNGAYTVLVTDVNGCTATSAIFNYISTGTTAMDDNNTVVIYPNPSTGQFTIEITNSPGQTMSGSIELYNLLGLTVATAEIQQPLTAIDISHHPNGVYMVCITTEKGKQIFKVSKR